jgi:xanthine dehydrogenase YagR molybdenum-binding subunit
MRRSILWRGVVFGVGTYTVLAQIVSEAVGVDPDKVEVVLGDSALPMGPFSGGSMVTASLIPAVLEAAKKATHNLKMAAATSSPFAGQAKGSTSDRWSALRTGAQNGEH